MNYEKVELRVGQQGAPIINAASIYKQSDEMVAIEIDLVSKYCDIEATGGGDSGPCILFGATERSLYLLEEDRDVLTEVFFEGYGFDWEIFAASCSRYTAQVVLIKR